MEKPLPIDNLVTQTEITPKDPNPAASHRPPDPLDAITSYPIRSFGELRDIAQAIIKRLLGAGYEWKPPANIHSVVEQLQLSRPQKHVIMERLAQQYPRGLGINFVG